VTNKDTHEKYAMKIYEKYKLLDKYKKNSVKNEIAVMKKLQHKNLVKLQEVIYTQKQVRYHIIYMHFFRY
jgi:serine/threonine-protein kinase NIM1